MPVSLGFQRWENLLFIHREVEPAAIQERLPVGLKVDTFDGRAYVSIVPFHISISRPLLFPGSLSSLLPGSSFVELNFRTYVRGPGGEPAVWFFSLDASSAAAVAGARLFYRLPYFRADMSLIRREDTIDFSSRRRGAGNVAMFELSYRPCAIPSPAAPGSLDHFLVERYVLFAGSGRRLLRARVAHVPYPICRADVNHLDENLLALETIEPLLTLPVYHFAARLDVEISAPELLNATKSKD